jgi:hypothetical protein
VPLTLDQKSNVRRHLKFAIGGLPRTSPVGGSLGAFAGYRWNQAWGRLEFALNNMAPDEEARLLGLGYGAVALMGPLVDGSGNPVPAAGNTVTVTFQGGALTGQHQVTATAVAGDSLLQLVARLAVAVNNDTTMQAANIQALAPYGTGSFSQTYTGAAGNPIQNAAIPLPEVAFTSPSAFQVVSVTNTGVIGAAVTATGAQLEPSAPVDWTQSPYGTVYGYLPICDKLLGSEYGTSRSLDTANAGGPLGWTPSMFEIKTRRRLYNRACVDMAEYIFGKASQDGIVGHRGSLENVQSDF